MPTQLIFILLVIFVAIVFLLIDKERIDRTRLKGRTIGFWVPNGKVLDLVIDELDQYGITVYQLNEASAELLAEYKGEFRVPTVDPNARPQVNVCGLIDELRPSGNWRRLRCTLQLRYVEGARFGPGSKVITIGSVDTKSDTALAVQISKFIRNTLLRQC